MPLVGPLNILMALGWIVALTALATPVVNPWAVSAQSQFDRVANQQVAAEEFDFGYLRFELGRHGDKALDDLLDLTSHPEAVAIRAGVERARSVESYWEYKNPDAFGPVTVEPDDGPMGLELNPEIDSAADAEPVPVEEPNENE